MARSETAATPTVVLGPSCSHVARSPSRTPKRSGRAVRLITHGGQAASVTADPSILLGIARGRDWWTTFAADPKLSVRTLAHREGLDPGYVGRMLKLAFLDPKLVQQFVNGTAPAHITQRKLL